jgi:nitronate monooxygenase
MAINAEDRTSLTDLLNIKYPIILAPMFLVSNTDMVEAACKAGITAAIPALNYRSVEELKEVVTYLNEGEFGPFGINLIVNKSNFKYKEQLKVCCDVGVDYIITSLGSPKETIDRAHAKGIKVFCDVTNLKYAKKVEALGADALIAVNKEAGGHAGKLSPEELITQLVQNCSIPVISAGGVGDSKSLQRIMDLGAAGASVGSIFIATHESPVSDDYKQAIVDYGAKDIVMTTKLSGTPCSVINTPYVQETGTNQNALERVFNKNRRLKKWFKALTFFRGMKSLENAAFGTTYKTVWCAGPTIEYVKSIKPINEVVKQLTEVTS